MSKKEMTCIVCPVGCRLTVTKSGDDINVEGNTCGRGIVYGKQEFTSPVRTVTSSIRVTGGSKPVVSVKTREPIDKRKIPELLSALRDIRVEAPCKAGDIVPVSPCDCGTDIIFTSSVAVNQ